MFSPKQTEFYDHTFSELDLTAKPLTGKIFNDCEFNHCNLSQSNLSGCRFIDCIFTNCQLSNCTVTGTSFRAVIFRMCKAIGIDFSHCNTALFELTTEDTDLRYGVFSKMNLSGISLINSNLSECEFGWCNLTKADFSGSRLTGTRFQHCDLRDADFRLAQQYCFDPRVNKLTGAQFSLPEVISLLAVFELKISTN